MQKFLLLFFFVILPVFIGCSNKVKVSGHVKFTDGEPVTLGEVCFGTKDRTYFGRINKNGYYTLGEIKDGDGIPPENYTVWLSGTVLSEPILDQNNDETGKFKEIELVDRKYTEQKVSTLTFEVKHGVNKFDFTVERPISNNKIKR
ncbi:MAG: hypothetical protein LBP87_02090 [Planctomycetaceae bacterium]|jgi:hypothetical protein|nr:hypothetical protein [Planctomycetaceae bacterium]